MPDQQGQPLYSEALAQGLYEPYDPATQAELNAGLKQPRSVSVPVSVGGYVQSSSTTASAIGTSRIPFLISQACSDLRLLFTNWFYDTAGYFDTDNTANLVVKCSIEDLSGNIRPVTFNGLATATIAPGGVGISDPLSLEIPAGSIIYVRTYTSGSTWHPTRVAQYSGTGGYGGFTVTTDLTATGAAGIADVTTSFVQMLGPNAILGTPLGSAIPPSILNVGDSIDYGQGDGIGSNPGYNTQFDNLGRAGIWGRALASTAGVLNIGTPGDSAQVFLANTTHFRRMALANMCNVMTVGYGTNDLNRARTLAQVQADLLSIWQMGANRRMKVYQRTLLPRTTSTDGWTTVVGQTVLSWESSRTALNNWIRDGAPTVLGIAVPAGYNGGLRAGQSGHPLSGYIEVADAVETTRNSGIWKAPTSLRTVNDGVATAGNQFINSVTGAFSTADTGLTYTFAGAGTAGGLFIATIARSNYSASQFVTNTNPITTVATGGTMKIGNMLTQDGVHPQSPACALIASAMNLGVFAAA